MKRDMKYLKVNEAFNDESTDKRRQLQEFSNDYLAYLIDDEWSVSVWGFTTSFKIVLLSPRSVKRNRVHHDDVQWLSVKNHIIPFVQMLSNRYHVGYEGSSSIIRIEATYSDDIHIRDIDQLEDLSDDMLFYSFSIVVKKDDMKHLKMFKESLNDGERDELIDFCETNLAYLMDEGFDISCDLDKYLQLSLPGKSPYGANPNAIRIKDPFDWNDIKDHFIPFLQLLSRRYELKNFGHRPSDYVVLFQGDRNKYATVEQVINDDLPTEVYHTLWSIVLKIRNKI
jgi:hypothetical protein